MDFETIIESEEQFWEELDDIVSTPCRSNDRIDDTLRTWLSFTTKYKEQYLQSEPLLMRCSQKLLDSPLYHKHNEYVCHQLLYGLLQEDEPCTVHTIAAFLLLGGRHNEKIFKSMNAEGAFARLVELIKLGTDDKHGLHKLLLMLLYEMSRIQRLSHHDLMTIDDAFIRYLFHIIEGLANDVNDPHHYPVIRILLVLNEQYMLYVHTPIHDGETNNTGVTNHIINILSTHGNMFKTFGESIILLLNRESEISTQLLILKLLYLLFTSVATYEYFYTNDLYVLVDIIIRNLLDLPSDLSHPSAAPLRHTYLRVFYPLLSNTQLRHSPHYKEEELKRCLWLVAGRGNVGIGHFDGPDETTLRLVARCKTIEWLADDEGVSEVNTTVDPGGTDGVKTLVQSDRFQSPSTCGVALDHAAIAKRILGVDHPEALDSSLSVSEVAAYTEKPGVLSPSRVRNSNGPDGGDEAGASNGFLRPGTRTTSPARSPFEEEISD